MPSSSGSLGNCDGCPSSAATLRGAVEVAILEAAPEVTRIVVEEPSADEPWPVPIALGFKKPQYDACPTEVAIR